MRRVLLAVSDASAAEGLRRSLRVFSATWELEVVTSLAAAREALTRGVTDAVVCDARMPDGDVESWLVELKNAHPTVVRAVLAGLEVGPDVARRLVQFAQQVIRKPVIPAQLFELVERTCVLQASLTSKRLRLVVNQLGALPPLPATYARIVQLASNPEVALDTVATIVERDPAISANVLRIINSAYFGLPRRVSSVRETVRYLGIQPLKNLVLTVEIFEGLAKGPRALALQQQALSRACAMRELLGRTAMAEAAFMAGVLCDVGELLLVTRLPIDARAIEKAIAEGVDREEAERARLGCTHADLGGALLAMWNLPSSLVEAIVMHHHAAEMSPPANVATALALVCALEARARCTPEKRAMLDAVVTRLSEVFPAVAIDAVERQLNIVEQAAA